MKLSLVVIVFFVLNSLFAGRFTDEEKLQGYAISGDDVTFIFDPLLYNVAPKKVVVTGAFRSWDTNMNKIEWRLEEKGKLWILTKSNKDYAIITPNSKFKFMINKGEWMQPPADAPNRSAALR